MRKLAALAFLATAPVIGHSAIFGPLCNFDVVNDTGKTAHGFEIDIRDIHASDITSLFGAANRWPGMERYGAPTVTEFTDAAGFGVKIVYQAALNGGAWSAGTPTGTIPTPHDSCWPLGAAGQYGPAYPCDHFGVSTKVNTPNVSYSWLVESSPGATTLTPVQATVPNPVWTVTPQPPVLVQPPPPAPGAPLPPPVLQPQPPKVNVAIAAPPPNAYEFGEPRWVKVTASGTLQNIAVEDLVAENAVLKKAQTQVQVEWQLLQVDSGSPGSGQIDLTGVALDPGATGVVYRFEFYKYSGPRDPQTNQALPVSDTPANGPAPGELGQFIVAQNAGVNFDGNIPAAPPLPIAPSINATISGAIVNQPYNQPISATPGNAADTLSIAVAGLPNGLSFDNITNAIVGTPTQVGSFPLSIVATDISNGLSTTATTNLDVAFAPVAFNVSFPAATQNSPFSYTFSATGNGAISYSILEALPTGLSLSADTLAGTPTVYGNFPLTITAKDAQGFSQNVKATLAIAQAAVVVPPPPPPPVACAGTNQVINNVTARNPVWIDVNGGLAQGGQSIYLPPQNQVTIVPPLTAATAFKPGNLITYSGTLSGLFCSPTTLTVAQGLTLPPVTLPNAQAGLAYPAQAITPTGGVPPYTVVVSQLPAGLAYANGAIAGTPAASGSYTVGVSVSDNNGQSVFSNASLTIDPAPAITLSAALPNGQVGFAYPATSVSASGGIGNISVTASGLPAGLSLSGNTVSGKPTAAGTFAVVFTAKDSFGTTATANASLTIAPPPAVNLSATLAAATVGSAYSASVSATGGVGAITLSATGLPAGLSLSGNTISGKPTTAGSYTVALTATDSIGTKASATLTLVVNPAVCPASGKESAGQYKVTAVGANSLTMANGAVVNYLDCTKIEWNRKTHAFKVGDSVEWQGYIVNGSIVATILTVN